MFWLGLSSRFAEGHLLTVSPPGGGRGYLANVYSYKGSNLIHEGSTPIPNYLPMAPPTNINTLGTTASTYDLDGGGEIQSTAGLCVLVIISDSSNWRGIYNFIVIKFSLGFGI